MADSDEFPYCFKRPPLAFRVIGTLETTKTSSPGKGNQNKVSRLDGVSSDLMPDSRLEMPGMLDCCPIGDHSHGDNVQDVFPHNRNKTFMTLRPQKKLKVHTQDTRGSRPPTDTLGGMLLRADTPRIFGDKARLKVHCDPSADPWQHFTGCRTIVPLVDNNGIIPPGSFHHSNIEQPSKSSRGRRRKKKGMKEEGTKTPTE
ncbi:hypothetical protein NQZ68_000380 [Dissostichus eleginoides]|nr:hypothetical protein NQZ68_000380 [Dissostichus eleginoides]